MVLSKFIGSSKWFSYSYQDYQILHQGSEKLLAVSLDINNIFLQQFLRSQEPKHFRYFPNCLKCNP